MLNMTKIIIAIVMAIGCVFSASSQCAPSPDALECSQDRHEKKDRAKHRQKKSHDERVREIMEFKMKYLAQEMELTEAEKARFFSTYEAMSREKGELFENMYKAKRRIKKGENLTDKDYEQVSVELQHIKKKLDAVDERFDKEFTKFLTAKQIYKMHEAEQEFLNKVRRMRNSSIKKPNLNKVRRMRNSSRNSQIDK